MRRGETAKFMLRVSDMRELYTAFAHFAAGLAAKCAPELLVVAVLLPQGGVRAVPSWKLRICQRPDSGCSLGAACLGSVALYHTFQVQLET